MLQSLGVRARSARGVSKDLSILDIMPTTCAYRLKHEGRPINIDIKSLKVAQRVIPETDVQDHELTDYVIDWITCGTEN